MSSIKKSIIGLFLLSSVSFANNINNYISGHIGWNKYDSVQNQNRENLLHENTFYWDVSFERLKEYNKNFEFGFGISYQDHGEAESTYSNVFPDIGYTSIPIYASIKYNIDNINGYIPFFRMQAGYSINDEKDSEYKVDNGLYMGLGIGLGKNNFIADIMYKSNNGKLKWKNNSVNLNSYNMIMFGLGYKF